MIGYLKGRIQENGTSESSGGKLLVAVEFPGGGSLGYQLATPSQASYALLQIGQSAEFHVYTHVREDALDLFGFLTRAEKELFLSLISVNGIGPKVALSVLSAIDPGSLVQAVLGKDHAALTKIPGIGKKTAERLTLELADPLQKKFEAGLLGTVPLRAVAGAGSASRPSGASLIPEEGIWAEAKQALLGLGYRENEVQILLRRVLDESKARAEPPRTEEVIRLALQRMPS